MSLENYMIGIPCAYVKEQIKKFPNVSTFQQHMLNHNVSNNLKQLSLRGKRSNQHNFPNYHKLTFVVVKVVLKGGLSKCIF